MSGIIRVKKDRGYFVASNVPFNDKRLSWEAKGMMGYLLSKPDDWECRNADLIRQTEESDHTAGEYKVNRILGELKDNGYMRRIKERTEAGTFDWTTEVYEHPAMNPDVDQATIPQSLRYGHNNNYVESIPQSSIPGSLGYVVSTDSPSTETTTPNGAAGRPATPKQTGLALWSEEKQLRPLLGQGTLDLDGAKILLAAREQGILVGGRPIHPQSVTNKVVKGRFGAKIDNARLGALAALARDRRDRKDDIRAQDWLLVCEVADGAAKPAGDPFEYLHGILSSKEELPQEKEPRRAWSLVYDHGENIAIGRVLKDLPTVTERGSKPTRRIQKVGGEIVRVWHYAEFVEDSQRWVEADPRTLNERTHA